MQKQSIWRISQSLLLPPVALFCTLFLSFAHNKKEKGGGQQGKKEKEKKNLWSLIMANGLDPLDWGKGRGGGS